MINVEIRGGKTIEDGRAKLKQQERQDKESVCMETGIGYTGY